MSHIVCPIYQGAKYHGKRTAIVTQDSEFSYAELDTWVGSTQIWLKNQGIRRHDRVAILSQNCVEHVVVFLALWRMGAVACLISPRFPKEMVQNLLEQVNCKGVITQYPFTSLRDRRSRQSLIKDCFALFHSARNDINTKPVFIRLNHEASILWTSGSTGTPKAVVHTYANHYYSALGANENIPLCFGDRWLLSLPLYHVGGLAILFRVFLSKATLAIPNSRTSLTQAIARLQPTHLSLVYTQLYRLLIDLFPTNVNSPDFNIGENRRFNVNIGKEKVNNTKTIIPALKRLRAILLGGSAFPKSILKKATARKLVIYTTYGSTEMASQVTATRKNDSPKNLLTSGKALKYRQIKIHTNGEILLKGKTLFKGYLINGKVCPAVDKRGWYHCGDLGKIDKSGYLTVLGRKDNMLISGGENIYPEEIEKWLTQIPGVSQARVIPIEDKEFGFRPIAFLNVRNTTTVSPIKIRAYLEKHLPRFKIPDDFYFLSPKR